MPTVPSYILLMPSVARMSSARGTTVSLPTTVKVLLKLAAFCVLTSVAASCHVPTVVQPALDLSAWAGTSVSVAEPPAPSDTVNRLPPAGVTITSRTTLPLSRYCALDSE